MNMLFLKQNWNLTSQTENNSSILDLVTMYFKGILMQVLSWDPTEKSMSTHIFLFGSRIFLDQTDYRCVVTALQAYQK